MKICGYGLRDYLQLLAPALGLIAAVFVLRLVLDAAGAPSALVRVFSVTVSGAIGILLTVLLIHVRHFGSYGNVVVAAFLVSFWQHILIVGAILFSIFTGTHNIFMAPEYSPGGMLNPWRHIVGHLTFGLVLGALFGTAMGCLLLWLLQKQTPVGARK